MTTVARRLDSVRMAVSRHTTDRTVLWVPFAVLAAVLIARNGWVFSRSVHEYGDEALNSILARQGKHLSLLFGNYSRVGFHHPGPAFIYLLTAGELLFRDLLPITPRPYNAQFLGALLFESFILALSVRVVWRQLRSPAVALLVAAVPFVFLAYQTSVSGNDMIASTWMPYLYMPPTMLLLVSGASVTTGSLRELPYMVFAGLLLVHGHVSFFVIVGGIVATTLAVPLLRRWRTRRPQFRVERRPLVISGAWAALFAAPILADLILHWPGEFKKYIDYSTSSKAGHHTLKQAVEYMDAYWWHGSHPFYVFVAVVLTAAVCAWTFPDPDVRRYFVGVVILSCAASALMVYYALRGIDDITQTYIGLWSSMTVPLLLIVIGVRLWVACTATPSALPRGAIVAAVLAAGVAAATVPQITSNYNPDPDVAQVLSGLEQRAAGRMLTIDVGPNIGPDVPGVVLEAARRGQPVCLTDPAQALFVTSKYVCSGQQRHEGYLVYARQPAKMGQNPTALSVLGQTEFSARI
ncbi:hypothetical protein [Catenulispora subtropica]|uniref:Glycosyltransferase RgtA/B/C/D-like domain-containing protein n=1 Tax=Catenulispora subtropica TaxID=450798 RepID=A0ABN2S2L0_9ACTN